jgi:hypothetical protein
MGYDIIARLLRIFLEVTKKATDGMGGIFEVLWW